MKKYIQKGWFHKRASVSWLCKFLNFGRENTKEETVQGEKGHQNFEEN